MPYTSNLGLPLIAAAQAQKHVPVNESLHRLDALCQLTVLDRNLTAPPGSPDEGDRYIVGATATGLWTGWEGSIVAYYDGAWTRLIPNEGWQAYIVDEDLLTVYDGAGNWDSIAGSSIAVLGDVDITTPSDGQMLQYNSSTAKWENVFTNLGQFKGAAVYKSGSTQATSAAHTAVTFDAELFDTDAFHSNSTNNSRITIPSGKGITKVRLTALLTLSTPSSGLMQAWICKNGESFPGQGGQTEGAALSGTDLVSIDTGPIECADGDYFEVKIWTGSAGSLTNTAATRFSIEVLDAYAENTPPLSRGAFGSFTGIKVLEEEVTCSGATTDTTGLARFPDRAIVLGASVLVTQAITGATSFGCGIAGQATKFGGTLGITLGSNNQGVIGPEAVYAITPVRLTANGSNFTGGKVRVAIHYIEVGGPTS